MTPGCGDWLGCAQQLQLKHEDVLCLGVARWCMSCHCHLSTSPHSLDNATSTSSLRFPRTCHHCHSLYYLFLILLHSNLLLLLLLFAFVLASVLHPKTLKLLDGKATKRCKILPQIGRDNEGWDTLMGQPGGTQWT